LQLGDLQLFTFNQRFLAVLGVPDGNKLFLFREDVAGAGTLAPAGWFIRRFTKSATNATLRWLDVCLVDFLYVD